MYTERWNYWNNYYKWFYLTIASFKSLLCCTLSANLQILVVLWIGQLLMIPLLNAVIITYNIIYQSLWFSAIGFYTVWNFQKHFFFTTFLKTWPHVNQTHPIRIYDRDISTNTYTNIEARCVFTPWKDKNVRNIRLVNNIVSDMFIHLLLCGCNRKCSKHTEIRIVVLNNM